jgi:GxxExxY protein
MPINLDTPVSQITKAIIGAAIHVHRELGPGLLESTYQACLCYELGQRNITFKRQVPLPVKYREVKIDCGYRLDFLVQDLVIVEIKSVDKIAPIHKAQVITYLKLMERPVGLLINFNVVVLKRGIRRLENHKESGEIREFREVDDADDDSDKIDDSANDKDEDEA